jgi:hypothetical protein
MKNTEYRDCWRTDDTSECVFACKNEYGVHCCSIDGIVQTRWYGCTPQEVIDKSDEK